MSSKRFGMMIHAMYFLYDEHTSFANFIKIILDTYLLVVRRWSVWLEGK